MNELRILFDLCLFQAKPQDFPYSQAWMLIAAVVLSTGIYVSYPVQEQSSVAIAWISIVHVLAYGFSIWAVLRIREIPERFVQTLTSILGTSAVLQLVTWPFVNWLVKVQSTPDAQVPLLIIFGIGIWTFAIAVHINRHAMEVTIGQSILITLGIQLFTASIVFILFGAVLI
jgi:hypothetical protein